MVKCDPSTSHCQYEYHVYVLLKGKPGPVMIKDSRIEGVICVFGNYMQGTTAQHV